MIAHTDVDNPSRSPRFSKQPARQHRLLAQHVILEEAGIPGFVRMVTVAVGLITTAFIAWAGVTEIDEVAAAPGEVVPSGQVRAIQHFEGGIIADILVEDGDLVDQGQTLLRLDRVVASADLEEMRAQRAGLLLKAERLHAFAEERAPDFSFVGSDHAGLAEGQRSILEVQEKARANRRAVVLNQIQKSEHQLNLLRGQEVTQMRIVTLAEEELEMRNTLHQKGLTSRLKVLDIQRKAAEAYGGFARLQGELRVAAEDLAESRSRLAELDAMRREEALSELDVVTRELARINEALTKREDQVQRLEIRAPVHGIVKGLKAHTVGGVVPPGAVVLEIVPMDADMIVEARISTRDVGHINKGQPVTLKITAYDYARYGSMPGELTDVSATTFLGEDGVPYYKGVVTLGQDHVGVDPERNRLMPGMTVEADIKTGRKTLLQYLLKPVYAYASVAFRER